MPTIRVKENEPFEVALRRFKRTIEKSGLLTELRAREFYEKPTAERKRKKAAAIKRHYKRLRSMMLPKKLYSFFKHFKTEAVSDEEIQKIVDEVVTSAGLSGPAARGKAMGMIKPKVAGKADMGRVSALLKARLAQ